MSRHLSAGKIRVVARKTWTPLALKNKAMCLFSLFLRQGQIKFGTKRRIGLIEHDFGRARQASGGPISPVKTLSATAATAALHLYRSVRCMTGTSRGNGAVAAGPRDAAG